jgi:hypothetical protein
VERYELPSPFMRVEADDDKFREDKDGLPGKYIISIFYSLRPSYAVVKPELGRLRLGGSASSGSPFVRRRRLLKLSKK